MGLYEELQKNVSNPLEQARAIAKQESNQDNAILPPTANFLSGIITATGSAQNIAHGLGDVPTKVLVAMVDVNFGNGKYTIIEGTHTSTNLVITISGGSGMTFKVIAAL